MTMSAAESGSSDMENNMYMYLYYILCVLFGNIWFEWHTFVSSKSVNTHPSKNSNAKIKVQPPTE
jgi:hypothetical protein